MRYPCFPLVRLALGSISFALSLGVAEPGDPAPSARPQSWARDEEQYHANTWDLVFSDEFDSGTTPDPKKWAYEEGLVRNNELQFYTRARSENARVEQGQLVITGRKEAYKGSRYTSASLTTQGLSLIHI